jgi:hypothetical protein
MISLLNSDEYNDCLNDNTDRSGFDSVTGYLHRLHYCGVSRA